MMQVLDGKRRPSGGMVRLGTGARPSIFAQQQNRLGQGRVIDVIWNKYPRMTELEVRSHLAKLGFRGDTVFKPCEALSGGELARLRFAEIVQERHGPSGHRSSDTGWPCHLPDRGWGSPDCSSDGGHG